MRRKRIGGVLDRPKIRHKKPFPYAKFPREDQLDIVYKKFKDAMEHPGHITEEIWFKGIIGELIDELQKDIGWSQLMSKDGIIEQLESRVRELEAERDRLKHTAKELGDSFDRGIDREDALRIENNKLRARHAALVEAAELLSSMVGAMMVRMTYCREILMATKIPSNKVLSMLDITTDKEIYDEITTKAALAEVKG